MSPEQTAEVLAFLAATYERDLTEGLLAGYTVAWADADAADIQRAAVEWLRSDEAFMPRPGQLLAMATQDVGELTAEEAWGEVRSAVSEVGYCGVPCWTSERVGAAAKAALGDWSNFCRTVVSSEMVAHRARFIEAYNSISSKAAAIEARHSATKLINGGMAALPGMADLCRLDREN